MHVGCWSRQHGITARSTATLDRSCALDGRKPAPLRVLVGMPGNHRLHHRWEQFTARKKRPVIANVAVARELAGWCWSLAVVDDQP